MFGLIGDCFRFVTGYFEIISASSPHIYHSALVIAPQKSMVRELYESHARPFIRVVCGVPISRDASTAAATRPSSIDSVVWSPCNRFVAITWYGAGMVDVLDSTTLQRLQTLELPQDVPTDLRVLIFSPDSRILTYSGITCADLQGRWPSVVSWDLQTGGASSVIGWQKSARHYTRAPSITYSANGEMVGVACYHSNFSVRGITIFVYDVASGVPMHSHSLDDAVPLGIHIWTHGESLRFSTANATTITIWEVGFVPGATPTEVEALPAPVEFDGEHPENAQLHPSPFRLAFVSWGNILVWDVRNSRYLLDCADAEFVPLMSFSSDGRFFACSTSGSDIYLWKESPAGYMLRGTFTSNTLYPNPLLARNGKSIVAFGHYGHMIQLWRTESFITPPSNVLIPTSQSDKDFILDLSSDGTLAAAVRRSESTVTVLSLRSGVPQLTIDANMAVYGLRVIGNTVVIIGDKKAITWDLPAGDCVPGAWVGLEDSSRTINLSTPPYPHTYSASISPDFRHIALVDVMGLYIHSASTGERLWRGSRYGYILRFSPGGSDVWCVERSGQAEVWNVSSGRKVPGPLVDIEYPPEGCPWGSSCGYRVTDDWWVLGPDGKRLLMLPPTWQSRPVYRVWKGKFLALLHAELSEPVILEL